MDLPALYKFCIPQYACFLYVILSVTPVPSSGFVIMLLSKLILRVANLSGHKFIKL